MARKKLALSQITADSDPRPGELREWLPGKVAVPGTLFLVTRMGVAPGDQWASTTTENACYFIQEGAEDWHYIDAVKFGSRVIGEVPNTTLEVPE